MLCDECQKRPTKVHITRIVNGKKTTLNLCEDCAQKYQKFLSPGLDPGQSFSIHKFLAGLLDDEFETSFSKGQRELKCPKCGLSYTDFSVHGKLGCGECYDTFREKIEPLLEKIHGSSVHTGKHPHNAEVFDTEDLKVAENKKSLGEAKLAGLRRELQTLVAEERFEEAAGVRDRIRKLESQIEGTS